MSLLTSFTRPNRGWRPRSVSTVPAQSTALGVAAFSANLAVGMLLPQDRPASITTLGYFIGAVGAGDVVDIGLYSFDGTTMTKLVSTGSQTCVGTSVVQVFTVAATPIPDTDVYLWIATGGVATIGRIAVTGVMTVKGSVHLQKAASFPLPGPTMTTFATSSVAPWIYAE